MLYCFKDKLKYFSIDSDDDIEVYVDSCGNVHTGVKLRQQEEMKLIPSNQISNVIDRYWLIRKEIDIWRVECETTTAIAIYAGNA